MGLNITQLRLSQMAAEGYENNPLATAYDYTSDATLSSNTTDLADGDIANLNDPGTFSFWSPDTSGITSLTLTAVLAASQVVNFIGLVAHNLGDTLPAITFAYSDDGGATWFDIDTVTVVDDSNIGLYFQDVAAGRFRLTFAISDGDAISIGALAISDMLAFPSRIYSGYTPSLQATAVELQSNVTEGGNYIGSSFVRRGQMGSVALEHLSSDFIRGDRFRAFQTRFNNGLPMFWAWRPLKYEDLKYAWRSGDVITPTNMGILDLMAFTMKFRAYDG